VVLEQIHLTVHSDGSAKHEISSLSSVAGRHRTVAFAGIFRQGVGNSWKCAKTVAIGFCNQILWTTDSGYTFRTRWTFGFFFL